MSQATPETLQSNIIPNKHYRYVYELPYEKRKMICDLLDINDKWKELGKCVQYCSYIRILEHIIF